MTDQDLAQELRERVQAAAATGTPLCIRGGDSKRFYGREPAGEPLEVGGHRGILSYEPSELVITARAGTPLTEIEQTLAEQGQMLPFEPPHFGPGATIGGAVASGLAGPRRPWGGAPRDLLLGVKLLDGKGQVLKFGGQVMKNVAGYDLARLMAGAMGCLGVLLEVSLKVLPRSAQERTLSLELAADPALELMRRLAGEPLPLTGACHLDGRLMLRLAASDALLEQTRKRLGAEPAAEGEGEGFWPRLRDHTLAFFQSPAPLWRLSIPPATPASSLPGALLTDWGGAQRWLPTDSPAQQVRDYAEKAGGHAVSFRNGDRGGAVFHPLEPGLAALHRRLKQVFDPHGLLNRGRMYADW
jgi:glycolate oxidase FAD binding subunit